MKTVLIFFSITLSKDMSMKLDLPDEFHEFDECDSEDTCPTVNMMTTRSIGRVVLPEEGKYVESRCTTIQTEAYAGDDELVSIRIPKCTLIDNNAFFDCQSLEQVDITGCTEICGQAFAHCNNLVSICAPNCERVGDGAFYSCARLKQVELPNVKGIDESAFKNCISLCSININMCEYISDDAFNMCTSLSKLVLEHGCIEIGKRAFKNCRSLEAIHINGTLNIGESAFQNCSNLSTVIMPECEEIGSEAFKDCCTLKNIHLPRCYEIGINAFDWCDSLTNVELDECRKLESNAFASCNSLQRIYAPSCTYVAQGAMRCSGLQTLIMPEVQMLERDAFEYDELTCLDLCECELLNAYALFGASSLQHISLENLKIASQNSFANMSALINANLPSIVCIGRMAFDGCRSLKSVSCPSLKYIGDDAFNMCTRLEHIDLNSCEYIGHRALLDTLIVKDDEWLKQFKPHQAFVAYTNKFNANALIPELKKLGITSSLVDYLTGLPEIETRVIQMIKTLSDKERAKLIDEYESLMKSSITKPPETNLINKQSTTYFGDIYLCPQYKLPHITLDGDEIHNLPDILDELPINILNMPNLEHFKMVYGINVQLLNIPQATCTPPTTSDNIHDLTWYRNQTFEHSMMEQLNDYLWTSSSFIQLSKRHSPDEEDNINELVSTDIVSMLKLSPEVLSVKLSNEVETIINLIDYIMGYRDDMGELLSGLGRLGIARIIGTVKGMSNWYHRPDFEANIKL